MRSRAFSIASYTICAGFCSCYAPGSLLPVSRAASTCSTWSRRCATFLSCHTRPPSNFTPLFTPLLTPLFPSLDRSTPLGMVSTSPCLCIGCELLRPCGNYARWLLRRIGRFGRCSRYVARRLNSMTTWQRTRITPCVLTVAARGSTTSRTRQDKGSSWNTRRGACDARCDLHNYQAAPWSTVNVNAPRSLTLQAPSLIAQFHQRAVARLFALLKLFLCLPFDAVLWWTSAAWLIPYVRLLKLVLAPYQVRRVLRPCCSKSG